MAFRLDKRTDPITKAPKSPCPPVLSLARWLGEHRTLVAGGVLDQPAGPWRACQYAMAIDQLLDRMAVKDFQPKDDREAAIVKQITEMRVKHPEWMG